MDRTALTAIGLRGDCSHVETLSDSSPPFGSVSGVSRPGAASETFAQVGSLALGEAVGQAALPPPAAVAFSPCTSLIHEEKLCAPYQARTYDDFRGETGKQGIEQLPTRLQRYAGAHSRALEMASFLLELGVGEDRQAELMRRRAGQLELCGSYLEFRHYFTSPDGRVRLHAAKFCQQDKLCPLCAIRRGGKLLRKYTDRVLHILEHRQLVPVMVTTTIKNRVDLVEGFKHSVGSYSALMKRGKLHRHRRASPWSESALAVGSVASVEVKRGKNSGAWHPHVHAVWLCEGRVPDQDELRCEWWKITGDSDQVDVRPFHFVRDGLPATEQNVAADFCEVFKYALKFSTMTLADNWHAFSELRGRHMIFPRGLLYGLDLPDDLADDESLELQDLPFIQLIYQYLGGRCS